MHYHAVRSHCAFDLSDLPIPDEQARAHLLELGFKIKTVSVVVAARSCIEHATYCRGVSILEAPAIVDCSSLIKWAYATKGIWLPRLCVQQSVCGIEIALPDISPGDAIYTTGYRNLYQADPDHGIGHAGLITEKGTVIHAAGKRSGVVEIPLERFIGRRPVRAIRRFATSTTVTLEVPPYLPIEWSDDIRWLLLRRQLLNHP